MLWVWACPTGNCCCNGTTWLSVVCHNLMLANADGLISCRQQWHLPEASPASLLGRIHELQEQREAMNGQLFSLKRSNEALQQDNTALTAQNTTMQRQTAQLQQECRQLRDEVRHDMPPSLGWHTNCHPDELQQRALSVGTFLYVILQT